MKKNTSIYGLCAIAAMMALTGCGTGASGSSSVKHVKLDPKNPQLITVWNYYNGMQQQQFNDLVDEFNATIGAEQGIIIETHSEGSVNELTDALLAAANKEVGAEEMPDIFAAYADTAYDFEQMGLVANLSEYLSEDEISQYMDSYIKEGYLSKDGELKLFPVAKSTEILMINETDWKKFQEATGADVSKLSTWEGIAELAEMYYNWTDAQTPDIANDGKAFFGRDAFANYIIIGSLQLGSELFKVDDGNVTLQLDQDVMRKLWDCYYVPYVKGWFGAYGKFRSDDIKTGQLIALVGSTSGASYFPSEVTFDDGTTYPIEAGVYALPNFEGTDPYAVQQGAGMAVSKSTEEKEYAATVFLKWFTEADQNIQFSIHSGYLPVKKEANDIKVIDEAMDRDEVSDLFINIITVAVDTASKDTLYTSNAFKNGNDCRKVLEYNMLDAANDALQKKDEMMASGMSYDDAVAELTGDAAFEQWFTEFSDTLNRTIEK